MILGGITKATEHQTDQSASGSPPLFLPLMLPEFLPLRMDHNKVDQLNGSFPPQVSFGQCFITETERIHEHQIFSLLKKAQNKVSFFYLQLVIEHGQYFLSNAYFLSMYHLNNNYYSAQFWVTTIVMELSFTVRDINHCSPTLGRMVLSLRLIWVYNSAQNTDNDLIYR